MRGLETIKRMDEEEARKYRAEIEKIEAQAKRKAYLESLTRWDKIKILVSFVVYQVARIVKEVRNA